MICGIQIPHLGKFGEWIIIIGKIKEYLLLDTGFKGTWLTILLLEMGAIVKGYSIDEKEDSLLKKYLRN